MSTYSLNNTSAEINCTISETYCRLTGSCVGPLIASSISNSGFLIQNGNKQTGLFVGNSCFIFGNNTLDFSKTCQNLTLRLPESGNFLIQGQSLVQLLNFKCDGSLMIGYPLPSSCPGLQINNCFPSLVLTDINSSGQNQSISFRNNSGNIFSKFFNNPSASVNSTTTEATQISYNKALIFNEFDCVAKAFLSGGYLSLGFESCINTGYNLSVNGSGYFSCGLCSPSIVTNGNLSVSGSGHFSCSLHSKNIVACNYLSVGFPTLNTGYNLSVSGSGCFSCSLYSSNIIADNCLVVGFPTENSGYNLSVSGSGCFSCGLCSPEIVASDYLSVGFPSLNTGYNLSVSGSACISSNLSVGGGCLGVSGSGCFSCNLHSKNIIASECLSVGFPSLNTGYNLSVSGSGCFSCGLCSSNIIANGNLSVSGSGCFSCGLYSKNIVVCDYINIGFPSENMGYNLNVSGSAHVSSNLSVGGDCLTVSGSGCFSCNLHSKNIIVSECLSVGFPTENTGYNLSVSGSGYFSCGLHSSNIIADNYLVIGFPISNTGYNLNVSGSGCFSCNLHSKNIIVCDYVNIGFPSLNTGYNLNVSGSAHVSSNLSVGGDCLTVSGCGHFLCNLYSKNINASDCLSVGFDSSDTDYNLSVSGSGYISSDLNIGGDYLSVGFDFLNTGYNLTVNGSAYFSSDLYTCNISAKTGYFCGNDLFLKGSGDCSSINICNELNSGLGIINFYNSSGAVYNKITSNQAINGGSELNFYTTSTGSYNSINRAELALKICSNKSVNFYGNILSQVGEFNSYLSANEFRNSGSKTFLNTGILGAHCLLLNDSTYIYSYCSISGAITDHIWYGSGNNAVVRINRLGNFTSSGSIFSHSGICTTGSLCVNNAQLNSCIVSKCVILSGNGSLCNINLFGNVQTCGSFENNSSGQAKFFGICSTGIGDNIISGNLLSCSRICSSGGVCSIGCIQSSSCGIFNQGVVSNSWVCAQNSGVFGSVVCALGTTNTNCFCSSVNVCGSVNAVNTAKAWGIYGLNNNSTPTLTGLNIKSINIYQNQTPLVYAYGICFNNPVTYPFVINFNVYSSGNALISGNNSNLQNGEPLGFSGVTSTSTHLGSASATVAYPFSVQFYALSGKRSSDNTLAAYSAGTSYSEIYFNLANQDGPTTNYADLTRANAHGIIHFSIFGQ